jgi:hypothetical protein
MSRVDARMELEQLRLIADQQGESGYDPVEIEPDKILVPA